LGGEFTKLLTKKIRPSIGATTISIKTCSIMGLFESLSINDIEHNVFSGIMLIVVMLNVVAPKHVKILKVKRSLRITI
jgi:hypothetical protein